MNNEEAKKLLEATESPPMQIPDLAVACHIGAKAIEKQIPKKPIATLMTSNWIDGITRPSIDCCKCPNCGREGTVGNGEYIYRFRYCTECGQAIDWSIWIPIERK